MSSSFGRSSKAGVIHLIGLYHVVRIGGHAAPSKLLGLLAYHSSYDVTSLGIHVKDV